MKKLPCLFAALAVSAGLLTACQPNSNGGSKTPGRTGVYNTKRLPDGNAATNVPLVPADSIAR